MEDRIYKILNGNQTLRERIGDFKEAFIEYYGEDSREYVEKQFSKMLLIGFLSPKDENNIIKKAFENKSNELHKRILTEAEIEYDLEDMLRVVNYDFEKHPLRMYHKFRELHDLGKEGRLKRFREDGYHKVKEYLPEINSKQYDYLMTNDSYMKVLEGAPIWIINTVNYYRSNNNAEREYTEMFCQLKSLFDRISLEITIDNFTEYTSKLDRLYSLYQENMEEYLKYKKEFEPYIEKLNKIKEREEQLKEKYLIRFFEENIDLVAEEDREQLLHKLKKFKNIDNINNSDKYKKIFCLSLSNSSCIEAFSSEAEERLKDQKSPEWAKEAIMNDRISYFKVCGINLGDNYSDYANNEEVLRIWPDKNRVDRLIESRNNLLNSFNIEFYQGLDSHQEIRKEIDALGLEDNTDSFNASRYTLNCTTMINPKVRKINGVYDIFSLFIFNLNNSYGYLDHKICHELNHIFELTLVSVIGDECEICCGWDRVVETINRSQNDNVDTLHDRVELREYELFSEIVNELIAQDISEIMNKNNIHIFDDPENAKYKGGTEYEIAKYIVYDFFNEFKDAIKESRRNGNMNIIFDEVGKENFDALNELIKKNQEQLSGFRLQNLRVSLALNISNELTDIYYSICDEKDEIMKKMREHSKMRKDSLASTYN